MTLTFQGLGFSCLSSANQELMWNTHRASILLEPAKEQAVFPPKAFLSPIINPGWSSEIYTLTSIPLLLCYLTSNPWIGHPPLNSKYSPPLVGKLNSASNLNASNVWGNISYHVFNDSSSVDNTPQSWSGWQVQPQALWIKLLL